MADPPAALPHALAALLDRGLLPHASLVTGGSIDQQHGVTKAACQALAIAPADWLSVAEPPTIAELRSIIGRIHLRPFQSKLSLLAFHQFDGWREECANLLLKTLEEPPDHARIVLYAGSDSTILRTILSRVARFRLPTRLADEPAPDLPASSAPLSEQFAWSKALAASGATTQSALSTLIGSAQVSQASAHLLAYASDVGAHPVNARLALDTALLIRRTL